RFGDRLILPRVADIDAGKRDGARSGGPREIDLGAERHQSRREIAAEGGEADAATLGRNVTDIARGLEAVFIGRAPPFALIVEQATRVETQIASNRSHVAMGRA